MQESSASQRDGWIVTLFRVVSYLTLIIPLLAFLLRGHYRRQFSFSLQNLPALSNKTVEELWKEIDEMDTDLQEGRDRFYDVVEPSPLIHPTELREDVLAPQRLVEHLTKEETEKAIDERIKKFFDMSTLILEAAYKEAEGDLRVMAELLQQQVRDKQKDYCFRFTHTVAFYAAFRGCHFSVDGRNGVVPFVPMDYQARFFAEGTLQSAWRSRHNALAQLLDDYGVRSCLTDNRFDIEQDFQEPTKKFMFTAK